MRYLLDTNICSYILKNRPVSVKQKFDEVGAEHLCISSVVLAELYYGAARHPKSVIIRKEIDDFVSRLLVVAWDEQAANQYGAIRAALEKAGRPVGAMDMLIAAHARSMGATLITNNQREFERISGLMVQNWVE
ncbi:tRNA(fMet)-specific endonuclease VapC [Trichlorobacter thiogenes]|uniref:Ribonuclease VapC n=1 Tax=Trichlorobacter thiogenes TaxID=115783 RepID=A0A1T4QSG1_9BACT|nr:type II toxin-antitoxin system VapC family toxin [Trichlorobacter thiogenes]SKA06198.1 tRNA(fMet)-specific endonuclease VapC [Trichlorobacter thiogenes]